MSQQIQITGGAKVRNLEGVLTGTSGVVNALGINVPSGIPQLDGSGKILVSQLPNSVMEYKGSWNAATNTPTLADGTGNAGDVYLCNVAGTANFGSGPIVFNVGDQVIYSGTIWQRASGATGTVTSVAVTESGDSLNVTGSPITTSGTINIGFNGTNLQYVNGAGNLTTFPTLLSSVGLSMPSAFSVANSPLTANGTIAVTGAGVASQYIRGDGTLANFPTSGGGGSSVSYYLNGSINQGTIGGVTYYEMNKVPVIGAGTDFSRGSNGYIASFLTDANDPALLEIPAGNWNFETYLSASSGGGSPTFYIELYKYDGTTFTLIASNSAFPKLINDGTSIEAYFSALAVPQTSLTLTDRLAVHIYVTTAGRTITLHTENSHLCQVITTFSTGLTALNGLTAQVQYFGTGTSGTDFNIASSVATHTFNLPIASAINTGKLSSTDWSTFNNKQAALSFTAPLVNTSNTISIPAATSLVDGYLDNLDWVKFNTAYNDSIISAAVTGTTTKTLTLNQQDGGTITASWTDDNTDAVTSVFGRTGAVVATSGDYNTDLVTEGTTNLYFTNTRSRSALSFAAGSGAYNSTTGVITIPTNTNQLTNGASFITLTSLSAGAGISYNNTTGVISSTITQYTDALARAAISLTTTGSSGASTYNNTTGVLNVPTYTLAGLGGQPLATNLTSLSGLTYASTSFVKMTAAGTFSLDTNTYALASALGNYLPLAGGIMTGQIVLKESSSSTDYTKGLRFPNDPFGGTGDISGLRLYADTTVGAEAQILELYISNDGAGTPQDKINFSAPSNDFVMVNGFKIWNAGNLVNPVTGTGTIRNIAYWASSSSITGESNLYWDDTNDRLGIGTNAPLTLLDSKITATGTATVNAAFRDSSTNGNALQIWNGNNEARFRAIYYGATPSDQNITFWTINAAGQEAERLRINQNGNIGIGIIPSAWSGFTVLQVQNQAIWGATGDDYVNYSSNAYYDGTNSKYISTQTATLMQMYRGASSWYSAASGTANTTISWGAAKMILTAAGNLGLGTETPTGTYGKLSVAGGISILNDNSAKLQIGRYSSGVPHSYIKIGTSSNSLRITNALDTADIFYFLNSGSLGINTDTPVNTAWGNATDTKQLSMVGSAYAVVNLTGGNGGTNRTYSMGVGDGNFYMAYDNTLTAHSLVINNGNVLVKNTAGISGGGALQVNGNVNINGVFQINGTTIGGGGGSGVTGSGTTNYVTKWTGASTIGNGIMYDTGSNVGIGTTAPTPHNGSNSLIIKGASGGRGIMEIWDGATTGKGIFQQVGGATYIGNLDKATTGGDVYLLVNGVGNNADVSTLFKANGNVLIGTTTDNGSKLQVNGSSTFSGALSGTSATFSGPITLSSNSGAPSGAGVYQGSNYVQIISGTSGFTVNNSSNVTSNLIITNAGVATFVSSVTATSFFESSDSRLKIVISDYDKIDGIEKVPARLYLKNGKKELGYFAQDLQEILPSAVIEGEDGFLNLSYSQVHTAKIAYLEAEIAELKELIKTLL
jgi:hypothetical protein